MMNTEEQEQLDKIKSIIDRVDYHWSVSDDIEFLYDKVIEQEAELAKAHNLITGRSLRVKVNLGNAETHSPSEIGLCNTAIQQFQTLAAEELETK